jgi:two-component system, OmpR family, sensor histidine kinase KdpD
LAGPAGASRGLAWPRSILLGRMTNERPDPDQLLADVHAQEAAARRGRLRIYFGASAGVGKTYAMLAAARQLREEGKDVVVGVVETHGRRETEALLQALQVLPRRSVTAEGRTLQEFDLDAALARTPALLLVDELAHTNVPGSRHSKRWQDVEELLAAGVDVFTTLNVQHLESLNDVVGSITGIRVWETVPDTFFDTADEVMLVDIPADELLARLNAGKVYVPEQVERAARNFFRKGNLMALRELALRRTADRVEEDVQAYRVKRAIEPVWKTEASLLCCLGPRAGSEGVVRGAARLAGQLGVDWMAVYVETPALQRLDAAARERILRTLKLAQDLGARTAVLSGADVATVIVEYARTRNCSKVVLGRPLHRRALPFKPDLASNIGEIAQDLDVIAIGREAVTSPTGRPDRPAIGEDDRGRAIRWQRYGWALVAVAVAGTIAGITFPYFELANIVMLFLLAVVFAGVRLGRGPAVLASFVSVAVFDFFFVPPRFSFAVSDVQYLLTFVVMLAVALVIGQLTAGVRFQASVASQREERSRAVSEFARELASLLETVQVVDVATGFIERHFRARPAILVPGDDDRLDPEAMPAAVAGADCGTAQWVLDNGQPAGLGTDTLAGSDYLYLPLRAPMRTRGVLVLKPENRRLLLVPEQRRQLETFATLTAISLERVHYVEVAQQALLRMESERLRNSLLSALSHDLRTPLAALVGLAESLSLSRPPLSDSQREVVVEMAEESRRLAALVNNLLDMARIESGDARLRRQWQPIEEVVGSAIKAARPALVGHPVDVAIAPDVPLVEIDAVLIERVLYNLLENAGKYTPPPTPVRISAARDGAMLRVTVTDSGPGVPKGQEQAIFEKFARGVAPESNTPGVGLGLAISRAIVEAHGGRIFAANVPQGGASFVFTLPLGTPPSPPPEDELNELTAETSIMPNAKAAS